MSIRVGIVGISGFGGGEAMRLVASHPSFELIYAAGEGSAGSRLVDRFPGVPAKLAELVIALTQPGSHGEIYQLTNATFDISLANRSHLRGFQISSLGGRPVVRGALVQS